MKKIDTTVKGLVQMIKDGELRLPEMQRRYVWTASRVRDLLDSLYRGYPSGMILVWETDREMPSRNLSIAQGESPFKGHKLLLDGQQRLTSLTAILCGEPIVARGRKRPIEVLFNLDHPDGPPSDVADIDEDNVDSDDTDGANGDATERLTVNEQLKQRTFVVANRVLLEDPTWVSVSDVFGQKKTDGELLMRLIKDLADPRFNKFSQRLQALRKIADYQYVMNVLDKELSYEEVANIFVRVNSLGVKLRGSDLALAQITSRWPESLALFESFQDECEASGFAIDLGLLARALVVFTAGQSRFRVVSKLSADQLKAGWEDTKKALRFSIGFLRNNAGIEVPELLSSTLFVITVGAFARSRKYSLSAEEQAGLKRWLYAACGRGHYSGSSETKLDADLNTINRGGGTEQLLDTLRQRFGRVEVSAADLAGRGQQSSWFGIVYLALKAKGAFDWKTGLTLSCQHPGKAPGIDYRHIFPKAVLTKAAFSKAEIHELANLAFCNVPDRREANKKPEKYLPAVLAAQGEAALKTQCIPTDPTFWKTEEFRTFLALRREALADAVNGLLVPVIDETPVPVESLIGRGESERLEFKSSARWDAREKRPNKVLEGVVAKTVAGFLNAKGGSLLIGVDDEGQVLGIEPDCRTFSKRKDSDGFQQFLLNLLLQTLDPGKEACSSNVSIEFAKVEDKEVCKVDVRPSRKPVYVVEGNQKLFYVRTGNTTRDFNMKETVEYIKGRWAD